MAAIEENSTKTQLPTTWIAWQSKPVGTYREYRSEESGKSEISQGLDGANRHAFSSPLSFASSCLSPSQIQSNASTTWGLLGKKNGHCVKRRVPGCWPCSWAPLHCAHYSLQAGVREGAPSAAGILWAKLLARIREETLHFVPGDDREKKWGKSGDSKQKSQGSKT